MNHCNECKKYYWNKHHECPPLYEYLDKYQMGDNWKDAYKVRAYDAEEAATTAAENMDSGNGEGATNRTITVRKLGEETESTFSITFDYSVDYHAREVLSEQPAAGE